MDDIDRGILYLLQQDARGVTTGEIADRLDVAASTVSTRLRDLEEEGVVRGYYPFVDYRAAGVPYAVRVVCTAPASKRVELADAAIDLDHVVGVQTYHTGEGNLHVTAVGPRREAVGEVETALDELGVTVERTLLKADERLQPFDHFEGAAASGVGDGSR